MFLAKAVIALDRPGSSHAAFFSVERRGSIQERELTGAACFSAFSWTEEAAVGCRSEAVSVPFELDHVYRFYAAPIDSNVD